MTAVFSCSDKLSYHGPKNRLFQSVGNILWKGATVQKEFSYSYMPFLKAMHTEIFVPLCSFTDSANLH